MELNDEIVEKLSMCRNTKEAAKLMSDFGVNVSESELYNKIKSTCKQELSDDELGCVTGGSDIINILVRNLTVLGREKIEELFKDLIK